MPGDKFTDTTPSPSGKDNFPAENLLLAQLGGPQTGRGSKSEDLLKSPPKPGEAAKPDDPAPKKDASTPAPPKADTPAPKKDTTAKPEDKRDTLTPKPPEVKKDTPAAPTEKLGTPLEEVKDGTLKLRYDQKDFDDKIWKTLKYDKIEITDLPKGAQIQHWMDGKGIFFWMSDASGKSLDGKLHYYPGNVQKLIVDGKTQDLTAERKSVKEAYWKKNGVDVKDGVLTISFNDEFFDRKLFVTDIYDTINIKDLPKDAKLSYGADDKGFFFDIGDKKKHYFPKNAQQIAFNGDKDTMQDLTKQRMQALEDYSKDKFGGFTDNKRFRDPVSNYQQVIQFADGMNGKAKGALKVLDDRLTEAVGSSEKHPYFKYMLANVRVAEAMDAVRTRVLAGEDINHPSVLDKLDKADELLEQAIRESDTRLRGLKRPFPRPNAPLMPLAPFGAYGASDYNAGLYSFWGGAWDQAGFMKVQLKMLKGLVQAGTLGLPPKKP